MSESNIHQNIQDCQFQKYTQAGLFAEDGDVVLLTEKEKTAIYNKAYRELNHDRLKTQKKTYYSANKETIKVKGKTYNEKNLEKMKALKKAWRAKNPEKAKALSKAWCAANPEKKKALGKAWRDTNPEKCKLFREKNSYANVKYDTYKDRLQKYEDISQASDGILLVVCAYCGKLYAPKRVQVRSRIQAINGEARGEHRFYCGQLCKIACPTYYQQKYYKFQHIGYTREVPAAFRHMALLDRNYTCENCGSDENGLHVHHINGYTEMPMFMADLSNVKVLCASCHKTVHSAPGCHFVDYSCKNQKI